MAEHCKSSTLIIRELKSQPDFVALHRHNPGQYPFILESAAQAENVPVRAPSNSVSSQTQGQFDILFACPQQHISLWAKDDKHLAEQPDFLQELDRQLEQTPAYEAGEDCESIGRELPFRGGWFVFLGYELAAQIEPTLRLPMPGNMPVAYAVRIPVAIIHCRQRGKTWLLAEPEFEPCLSRLEEDIAQISSRQITARELLQQPLREDPPDEYVKAVVRAKQYINDGDVFQANLSRTWHGDVIDSWHDAEMYRRLRRANPGPFCGLAVWGDLAIISSSPERLIELRDGHINTRPIAGTRPRGIGLSMDQALSDELIGNPKERAEHVMLIDLERNDLGRVCQPGSIEVNEMMVIESYAHVHHIVSNVRGKLRAGVTPGDALRATFPGGTITGCPKVRCMEIIAQLEGTPRGPYTGSMGYLNADGSGDFNILIRTIVRENKNLSLRAGAGIVADSDPLKELAETGFKAKGLIHAIMSEEEHQSILANAPQP